MTEEHASCDDAGSPNSNIMATTRRVGLEAVHVTGRLEALF